MKTMKNYILTAKFIYMNMWWGRSKLALLALVVAALYSTFVVYIKAEAIALHSGVFAAMLGFISWFAFFPTTIFLIDNNSDPQRIKNLISKDSA